MNEDDINANDIRTLAYQINALWGDSVSIDKRLGEFGDVTELLGQAASALFEAARCVENLGIRRQQCMVTMGTVHAIGDTPYSTLCNAELDSMQSVAPAKTIPDCPDCLAILRGQ